MMEGLKEIARRVWYSKNECMPADGMNKLTDFAKALIAEIAKQNEPVAFTNSAQLGYVTSGHHQDIPLAMWSRNTSYSGADIPLYTLPPTAEQISNETAEACAKACEDVIGNTPHDQRMLAAIDCAVMLRSGAWKEFKK